MTPTPHAARLSTADRIAATDRLHAFARESLDPLDLAAEIDYWVRQRDRWHGDLAAGDFGALDEATLRSGIAYAEHQLVELTRQANRYERSQRIPAAARPRDDFRPRFAAAKYADLVGIAETFGYAPRKRGSNYLMRCPFHDGDDTPSLTIYPPGRGWHCFGCGRGGDAVAFVAEQMHCAAVEALHMVEQIADTYPECWGAA